MEDTYPWYALHVRSRCELRTAELLKLRGYAPRVPTYKVTKRWSDRLKTNDNPIVPGYVFCRFDVFRKLPVVTTEGVKGIVGCGKHPQPVDEAEMQYLETVAASGLPVIPWTFQPGQGVRMKTGPLAGVEGTIVEIKKRFRLIVSLSLLQRSIAVEVQPDWIEVR